MTNGAKQEGLKCWFYKLWDQNENNKLLKRPKVQLSPKKKKLSSCYLLKLVGHICHFIQKANLPLLSVQFRGDCILSGSQHKTFFPYFITGKPNHRKENILQPFSHSSFFPYSFSETKHSLNKIFTPHILSIKLYFLHFMRNREMRYALRSKFKCSYKPTSYYLVRLPCRSRTKAINWGI